ncbi:type VI secretion system lipoprotein TssJ [Thiohalorhabdus methylotrophus]|uniref:Type VI secretion system lipoprotein TssJ n=1 Tax=Thiohalorhabdus methylotrophus TaxID=3242694 RepID=A0ABV4TSF5_9GAMM
MADQSPARRLAGPAAAFCLGLAALALGGCASPQPKWTGLIGPEPGLRAEGGEYPVWNDGREKWRLPAAWKGDKNKAVVPQGDWVYEDKALAFHLEGAETLNAYRGRSHSLRVTLIQLAKPAKFNELRGTPTGLGRLLTDEELGAVLSRETVTLYPGEGQALTLDRAEQARFLGIVAGYYDLDAGKVTRLIPIPPMHDRKSLFQKAVGAVRPYVPFTGPPPRPRPAHLKGWVKLGSTAIDGVEVRAH